MSDAAFPFALREMQRLLHQQSLWIGLVSTGLILGLVGPFGTDQLMRLVPRLAYWTGLVALSFLSGSFVSSAVSYWVSQWRKSAILSVVLSGLATGLVVSIEVLLVNWTIFGVSPFTQPYGASVVLNVTLVSCVVATAFQLHHRNDSFTPKAAQILDRLPYEKRGQLIALSVTDHYVEVRTTKGQEMLLMRLSDAIRECTPEPGLQTHRSHWVALAAVVSAQRDGTKGVLTLIDDSKAPVSRTYLQAVKEAGLLPG